jgi:hypothetical protein
MINLQLMTDRRTLASSSIAAEKRQWQRGSRRRFDRIILGFWLGGVLLGTAGCVLGACMPYHHPVARVISVLWWGIYCGCLGASVGALPGLLLKRPLSLPQQSEDVGMLWTERHGDGSAGTNGAKYRAKTVQFISQECTPGL